jgi:hypothetical protein
MGYVKKTNRLKKKIKYKKQIQKKLCFLLESAVSVAMGWGMYVCMESVSAASKACQQTCFTSFSYELSSESALPDGGNQPGG